MSISGKSLKNKSSILSDNMTIKDELKKSLKSPAKILSAQKENIFPSKLNNNHQLYDGNTGAGQQREVNWLKRISNKINGIMDRTGKLEKIGIKCTERHVQTESEFTCLNGVEQAQFERELNKLRFEILKLEKALKQAQENLALHKKNQNNTSSQFMLPSEFKSKWENLIKDLLPNVFVNILENPFILMNIVQQILIEVREQVRLDLSDKSK